MKEAAVRSSKLNVAKYSNKYLDVCMRLLSRICFMHYSWSQGDPVAKPRLRAALFPYGSAQVQIFQMSQTVT